MSTEFETVSFDCKTGVMTTGTLTVPDMTYMAQGPCADRRVNFFLEN